MTTLYNNIPQANIPVVSSSDPTVKTFNNFYQIPIQLNNTVLIAIQSYFESRGFSPSAAESVGIIILSQATKDGLNALTILDTLRGLTDVQISALVGEILNYNRFKTSSLGITNTVIPADEIQRNILL
jgi:hypothetical protein